MLERVIATNRLILRPPELSDAEAIFTSWATDPEVTRYLTWRPHRSLDETREVLHMMIDGWAGGRAWTYVVVRAADDAAIGTVAARLESPDAASIGYALMRTEWGKGYVSEAAGALVDALRARPEIARVWAFCDVDNPASARVMEKIGMQYEGRLARYVMHPNVSPEPRDVLLYAITR
jgi:RimJ/RimL family protein N-acetyltransferase